MIHGDERAPAKVWGTRIAVGRPVHPLQKDRRLAALAALVLTLGAADASADEPTAASAVEPMDDEAAAAERMANGSLTLLVGAQVMSAAAPIQVGGDASLRIVPVPGLYVQPRLGVAFNGSAVGVSWAWLLRGGAGIGWIGAVGSEVGLALGVGYDLVVPASHEVWLPLHRITAEAALPIVLGAAVIEPSLRVGAQIVEDGVDAVIDLGVRAGVTW